MNASKRKSNESFAAFVAMAVFAAGLFFVMRGNMERNALEKRISAHEGILSDMRDDLERERLSALTDDYRIAIASAPASPSAQERL